MYSPPSAASPLSTTWSLSSDPAAHCGNSSHIWRLVPYPYLAACTRRRSRFVAFEYYPHDSYQSYLGLLFGCLATAL
jgi:hypothetical protein